MARKSKVGNSKSNSSEIDLEVPLTKREEEVLHGLAEGKTNKEISEDLDLSIATVRNHLSTIFLKLRVKNRAQAAIVAYRAGIYKI